RDSGQDLGPLGRVAAPPAAKRLIGSGQEVGDLLVGGGRVLTYQLTGGGVDDFELAHARILSSCGFDGTLLATISCRRGDGASRTAGQPTMDRASGRRDRRALRHDVVEPAIDLGDPVGL